MVADLEAATLVGRRSEECRLDSPSALGGAALGRADGQHGGGRLEPAQRGASLLAPEAEPTDPGSLWCAACGCHRRVPEAPPLLALPPPPLLLLPPAVHRGEEAPEDRLAAARRGGEGRV